MRSFPLLKSAVLVAAGLVFACWSTNAAAEAEGSPTVEQIVRRALVRAALEARNPDRHAYVFQKAIVTEDLDAKGRVRERKEKEELTQGDSSSIKRIRINGRDLAGAELERQREADLKLRQKLLRLRDPKKGDRYEHYLDREVVARFEAGLLGVELLNGRSAYVISFRPRSGNLPVKHPADRLINRLSGKAWIDTVDYEIARTEIRLDEEVTFWAGLAGALKRVEVACEKTRLPGGVWLPSLFQAEFEGRKLLDRLHVRTRAESRDFRKVGQPLLGTLPPR